MLKMDGTAGFGRGLDWTPWNREGLWSRNLPMSAPSPSRPAPWYSVCKTLLPLRRSQRSLSKRRNYESLSFHLVLSSSERLIHTSLTESKISHLENFNSRMRSYCNSL